LVSIDVKSLFTNPPLHQTINIITDHIYSNECNDHPPINREVFIKLIHLATECTFLFKGDLYKQIDGVGIR